MSSTFQIVQPDGRVGPQVSLEDIVSEVAHGRLLGFDLLRSADGSVSAVSEHAACARIVNLLEERSTASSVNALTKQIGSIALHTATVRLLTWEKETGKQRAFWFRDGYLVGGRSSVKGELPEAVANESVEQRSTRAIKLLEVLGKALVGDAIRFSVIEDHAIKDVEIVAWFAARPALEAALLEGLSSSIILDRAELYGTLERGAVQTTHALCDAVDRGLAQAIANTPVTAESINSLSRQYGIEPDLVCARLHGLVAIGVLKASAASAPALRRRAQRLGEQTYFERLEIELPASADVVKEAFAARCETLGATSQADDTPAIRQARQEILGRLEIARDTLRDEHDQAVYGRAIELGVDYTNQAVQERLMREHLTGVATRALNQQVYDQAVAALERLAKDHPSEEDFPIKLGWAQFLMSERTPTDAEQAVGVVQRALKINPNSDDAYVTMGKIYSFADMTDKAKKALRTATEMNGDNSEAWALRRRLNAKRTGRGTSTVKLQLDVGQGAGPAVVFAMMVLALLYAAANVVPGGAKEWPRVGGQAAVVANKQASPYETELAQKVQERLKGKIDYRVPSDKQVMGNVESYYLVADPWFWGRRAILIVCALIGIFGISRSVLGDLPILGIRPILFFLALPYGVIVGFLSPLPATPTPLEYLLAMTFVNVLAEQLFFFGFVGRVLSKTMESPIVAIGVTALIFGAHQLTYYATLQLDPTLMFQGIAQMAAFAGGAYAFLWWISGGLFVPLVAHFLINGLMMFRAVQLFAA
ncbi:MAG: tetratricopeptide repeat protein [Myxococcota bacterium]|nr:tetratricopeptide repeat protein [Myxococcota bacterium]